MPLSRPFDFDTLAEKLGHRFTNSTLLREALIHPSLSALANKTQSKGKFSPYERLEFLGDRVLGLVIAQWLYEIYPHADEGELAKRHASLVNRDALHKIALDLELEDHLRVARADELNASRKNLAVMSDALEGILGALYLDGGLEVAQRFIKKCWESEIRAKAAPADPKTELQEFAQGSGRALPVYSVLRRSGPAHAPQFTIQVAVEGFPPVTADGGSKREAEKEAARTLLQEIHKDAK